MSRADFRSAPRDWEVVDGWGPDLAINCGIQRKQGLGKMPELWLIDCGDSAARNLRPSGVKGAQKHCLLFHVRGM